MLPQPHRIAINGYGRIGRSFLRAIHEKKLHTQFSVVHINEPANLDSMAYLTRFDSTHGRFPGCIEQTSGGMTIDGVDITVSHSSQPEGVNWGDISIDLLVECSGQYARRSELNAFLDAGAPRLLLSHPGHSGDDVDATIVYGINHHLVTGHEKLLSSASCTTNAVVPVLDLLDQAFGVDQVLLTTLHSVMNDQPLADGYHHADLRRTRSAMQSMIPVSTGLARGVERLLPQLAGRVQAKSIRVPTINVSAIDLVVQLRHADAHNTAAAVNTLLQSAAAGPWKNLIAYTDQPHASVDFNHDAHSAIVDGSQTLSAGAGLVNLLIWFDNEWGFANRMLDVARHWLNQAAEGVPDKPN